MTVTIINTTNHLTHTRDQPPSSLQIGQLPSSPIGSLWVAVSSSGVVAVDWSISRDEFIHYLEKLHHSLVIDGPLSAEPLAQLREYLHGKRDQFDLEVDLSHLTSFQVQVLQLTCEIPYGHTATYKDIALKTGNPNAARAVGRVEATNPIPIIIPCHRILGSDGNMHGYGGPGGIKLKAWLLELERLHV